MMSGDNIFGKNIQLPGASLSQKLSRIPFEFQHFVFTSKLWPFCPVQIRFENIYRKSFEQKYKSRDCK